MTDDIFGYTWAEIQRAQQGSRLVRKIDVRPRDHAVTEADRELLAQHGTIDALIAAGYHGTADRLRRADNSLPLSNTK